MILHPKRFGLVGLLTLSALFASGCLPYVKKPVTFTPGGSRDANSGDCKASDAECTPADDDPSPGGEEKPDSADGEELNPVKPDIPTSDPKDPPKDGKEDEKDKPEQPDPEPKPGPTLPKMFDVALTKLSVSNTMNAKPAKGDTVVLSLTLKNSGSLPGKVKVTPILTSRRFNDYANVRLPSQTVNVMAGETKGSSISIPPFFRDEVSKKEYALNRGNYSLAFDFEPEGGAKKTINDLAGRDFEIAQSNVVFTAVYWDQSYFDKMKYTGGVEKYLKETFTRKGENLKPSQKDGTTGTFVPYPNGFDEMMKIRTMFKTFDGFKLGSTSDGVGILKQVEAYGKTRLGLQKDFQGTGCESFTHVDNHGYDMEIGLSRDGFGGIAWVCGNTQASGVFDGDPSVGRSQMVLIHETGHNFGAPHCDPIQGFIMCSGEKHDHYRQGGSFVWHQNSLDDMKKHEPQTIENRKFSAFGEPRADDQVLATCNGYN